MESACFIGGDASEQKLQDKLIDYGLLSAAAVDYDHVDNVYFYYYLSEVKDYIFKKRNYNYKIESTVLQGI